jgi:hypothetical protein
MRYPLAGALMDYSYSIEHGDLCVAGEGGKVWRGRPDGMPVLEVVPIPDAPDVVARLEPEAGPRNALGDLRGWPNLVRVRPDGSVVWRAAAGQRESDRDWWTAVRLSEGRLIAFTWSCFEKTLDPGTGRILAAVYTK